MDSRDPGRLLAPAILGVLALGGGFILFVVFLYLTCRIEIPTRHMAVLVRKTGQNLPNGEEIAPSPEYKGVQAQVLAEGRHFRNPWDWDWEVVPQVEIPEGKLGVRIRLYGEDPSYGEVIARTDNQKGIVPQVLRPGRYPINARVYDAKTGQILGQWDRALDSYAEYIELHEPVMIPAGFKGVVTNLTGPLPDDPNVLLVESGRRGVQAETLDPGLYYVNPYVQRIDLIDCRSQRYNLSEGGTMGFPSRDGFWVTLDGIIEFRVMPEQAAKVFVTYNDQLNDARGNAVVDEEIVKKVILPNARSFCRLRGSDHSGKEFIGGATRTKFQEDFQRALETTCESQGIEIIHALVTRISPPQQIKEPVKQQEIAIEKEKQYLQEILQQESEQQFAIENAMIERKQKMIETEREVVRVTTDAERKQQVALIEAQKQLKVAELDLQAAQDMADATLDRGQAAADVIRFENEAEAAGWRKSVAAFGGSGAEFARWTMFRKLAPAFRNMMINTADSPIMDIFKQYQQEGSPTGIVPAAAPRPTTSPASSASAE